MIAKILLVMLLLFVITPNVSALEWTNITCIGGDAVKAFNSTINGAEVSRFETEVCGSLNCLDTVGCIDPRETPGELFLGMILVFQIGAGLFAYFGMKIDSPRHGPIRMLFISISLILIMSGAFMSQVVAETVGQQQIADVAFFGFIALTAVFLIVILYFVKEFVIWAGKSLSKKNVDSGESEDYDGI